MHVAPRERLRHALATGGLVLTSILVPSAILELRLSARSGSPRVEVLNFGTDGYGTLREARLLETRASRFDPDLVIVAYCLNDPANSDTPTGWFLDGKRPASYLVDLGPAFSRYAAAQLRLIPDDPIHPNALGHREAAQAILGVLDAERLVP